MGKRSLSGFFTTVAKGWGCVKAQCWHLEGASPYPMLGECPEEQHTEPPPQPCSPGELQGGAASSHPQLGTAGSVTVVWLCHPHQGCAWGCCWHGAMPTMGKCHYGTAKPAVPRWQGTGRDQGCYQGRWALAGEESDSRDMELPERTQILAGDKEPWLPHAGKEVWEKRIGCGIQTLPVSGMGRWGSGIWGAGCPPPHFQLTPVLGCIPASR